MKNLKTFNEHNMWNAIFNWHNSKNSIKLDEESILDLIKNENNFDVKQILLMISKKLNHNSITLSYSEKFINDESIKSIKSLGFYANVYDDSNEHSEDFHDKVNIRWNYTGKNAQKDEYEF